MSTTEPRDGQDHAPSVEPHAPLVTIANPAHPSEPRVINIPLIPSDPAPKPEEMFGPAAPPGARGAPPADSVGSTPASSHAVASQDPIGTKLFLGGLNYDTEEQGLRAYFGKWGTVTDCLVLRDRETEKSRGASPANPRVPCVVPAACRLALALLLPRGATASVLLGLWHARRWDGGRGPRRAQEIP